MASIYLIRHGQASTLSEDYDQLSPLGVEQSMHLGQYLKEQLFVADTVLTGTMKRHLQTADMALSAMSQPADIQQFAQLNELNHQDVLAKYDNRLSTTAGILEQAKQQADPKRFFLKVFYLAVERWTSGQFNEDYIESWPMFLARMDKAKETLISLAKGNNLVFTSGGPISIMSCDALGIARENFLTINKSLVNAGISKFIINSQNQLTLSTLNHHHYFEHNPKELITYT